MFVSKEPAIEGDIQLGVGPQLLFFMRLICLRSNRVPFYQHIAHCKCGFYDRSIQMKPYVAKASADLIVLASTRLFDTSTLFLIFLFSQKLLSFFPGNTSFSCNSRGETVTSRSASSGWPLPVPRRVGGASNPSPVTAVGTQTHRAQSQAMKTPMGLKEVELSPQFYGVIDVSWQLTTFSKTELVMICCSKIMIPATNGSSG